MSLEDLIKKDRTNKKFGNKFQSGPKQGFKKRGGFAGAN